MSTIDKVITGLFAFAGGVATGILLAPRSGSETRDILSREAQTQMGRVDRQLRGLEKQMDRLSDQVKSATNGVSQKVRHATVDQVVPGVPEDPEAFKVGDREVAGDLRHLPKK
jgi:gas vesicle protein